MEIAKVSISGVTAQTVSASPIPVGIVGATVTLEFNDPVWDGLTKNVVFVGTKDVPILDVHDSVILPAEAITAPNILVKMGIFGISPDGSMAIPTLWADLGVTRPATSVNMGTDPMLPVWAQLLNMIGNLRNLKTENKSNMVAALNEVAEAIKNGGNVDLSGYVKSVNGVTPDENGNVEIKVGSDSGQNSNGLSTTAANLLIEILESALYTDNMTGKIASLKEALASGGSSGGGDTPDVPDTPDEPDEPVVTDNITVTDGIMTIISVGSAITVSDGVMTIA